MTTTTAQQCILRRSLVDNIQYINYNNKEYVATDTILDFSVFGFNNEIIEDQPTSNPPPMTDKNLVIDTSNGCSINPNDVNKLISFTSANVEKIYLNDINMSQFTTANFTFGNLLKLTTLELMNTKITNDVLLYFLNRTPNIQELNLNNTSLTLLNLNPSQSTPGTGATTSPNNINLSSLKILKLNNTNISSLNLNNILLKANNLETLYLVDSSKNNYSSSSLNNPALFNNLKELYLYNVLDENGIAINVLYTLLNKMPNLEVLILGGNNFAGTASVRLNELSKLDALILDNTRISSNNLNTFLANTPNIRTLGLRNNYNIDDTYIDNIKDSFKKLKKLKNLDITREPDNKDEFMLPTTIGKIVDDIIIPNPSIDTIALPYVKDYDYANMTVRKYNQVIISIYKELNGEPEKTKDGYIIYDQADKTSEINNFRKGLNYTTMIVTAVLLIVCFMLFNYVKNM